jgi:hypothetical protein
MTIPEIFGRKIWCAKCAKEKEPGTRQIYERSEFGEPAEYERVVFGRALKPKPKQRLGFIGKLGDPNPATVPLDMSHYDCDNCNARIRPGEPCAAWTVWTENQPEPEAWEAEFLEIMP